MHQVIIVALGFCVCLKLEDLNKWQMFLHGCQSFKIGVENFI